MIASHSYFHHRVMIGALLFIGCSACSWLKAEQPLNVPAQAQSVITRYCISCHGEKFPKGKVRLDILGSLKPEARFDFLTKVQEVLRSLEMPPEDEAQPSENERKFLDDWISEVLIQNENLQLPAYGNFLDHEKLFSGEYKHLKGFTYDRRWLISEYIFNAKINHLIDYQGVRTIDGIKMNVIGDNGVGLGTRFGGGTLRQSITNPFLLPSRIGVRYYASPMLTGGHLLTMISNAKKIAAYMASEKTMKSYYPAMYRLMKQELDDKEILRSRETFLTHYIEKLLQDIYKEKHEALLPKFTRIKVDEVPEYTDAKGNPRKETNLELLQRNDRQDLDAIYFGIKKYKKDEISFQEVIEKCEKDWFLFGIHEKRLHERISLMHVLEKRWDMSLVYKEANQRKPPIPRYQPLAESEMAVIRSSILKHRKKGDRFLQVIAKCLEDWRSNLKAEREQAQGSDKNLLGDVVTELYKKIFERTPTQTELTENIELAQTYLEKLKTQDAIAKLIESLLLSTELVYRYEFGQGKPDDSGRRMLSPRDASYALAYALTDSSPDEELVQAVKKGQLTTREDYRREVTRMLKKRDQYYVIDETVQKNGFNSSITNTPIRKLRFFREFFGYTKALSIFKDDVRFDPGFRYDGTKGRLVDEADMLVDHILQKDKNVFEELLTTEKFYVYHSGNNEAMKKASDRIRKIYDYFKDKDWKNFTEEELFAHMPFIKDMKIRGSVFPNFENDEKRKKSFFRSFKRAMESFTFRLGNGQKAAAPYNSFSMAYWHKGNADTRTGQQMRAPEVGKFFNIDYENWDYPTTQPAKVSNRKGMLTHPAWLIAHSQNLETDPVRRGKWIREKLLAGKIPDVPITVDAVIPEDHHKTLRQRLEKKTGEDFCWRCHRKMDPLGLTFESYDDFGRYRTQERLEHPDNLIQKAPRSKALHLDNRAQYKTLPVESSGHLNGTGDKNLDGKIKDAFDLADRLAKSERVRQSIIRHAFRYFLGRNETLSDSKTLMDADQAYVTSGGSFDAVIVSLLTSDSFIYRKATNKQNRN